MSVYFTLAPGTLAGSFRSAKFFTLCGPQGAVRRKVQPPFLQSAASFAIILIQMLNDNIPCSRALVIPQFKNIIAQSNDSPILIPQIGHQPPSETRLIARLVAM